MIKQRRYGILDHLLGKVPKAYRMTCLDCSYHESLLVLKTHEEEPYAEGNVGMRTVHALPKKCPKCGGTHLRKTECPLPCD
jgi:hypothetical protein